MAYPDFAGGLLPEVSLASAEHLLALGLSERAARCAERAIEGSTRAGLWACRQELQLAAGVAWCCSACSQGLPKNQSAELLARADGWFARAAQSSGHGDTVCAVAIVWRALVQGSDALAT